MVPRDAPVFVFQQVQPPGTVEHSGAGSWGARVRASWDAGPTRQRGMGSWVPRACIGLGVERARGRGSGSEVVRGVRAASLLRKPPRLEGVSPGYLPRQKRLPEKTRIEVKGVGVGGLGGGAGARRARGRGAVVGGALLLGRGGAIGMSG